MQSLRDEISLRKVWKDKAVLKKTMILMGFMVAAVMPTSAGDIEDITKKANDMVQMMSTIQTTLDELNGEMQRVKKGIEGLKKEMEELKKEMRIKIDKKVS